MAKQTVKGAVPEPIERFQDAGVQYLKYQLPSGYELVIRTPTMEDLTLLEDFSEQYPGKEVRQVLEITKALAVKGKFDPSQLPPSDFGYLTEVMAGFFGG